MNLSHNRENPSPRYYELLSQYQSMHVDGAHGLTGEQTFPGQSLIEHVGTVLQLVQRYQCETLLDYGCGKALLYRPNNDIKLADKSYASVQELLGVDVSLYDPGYLPYAMTPSQVHDIVICTDVLEHCGADDIPWIVGELFSYAAKVVFANVACYPASKSLPNGENAHCTVEDVAWWRNIIEAQAKPGVAYVFICTLADGAQVVIQSD